MTDLEPTTSPCKHLGLQYRGIMVSIASNSQELLLAESLGLTMVRDKNNITVTISPRAAEIYIDPRSGDTLGTILKKIEENKCADLLNLSIARIGDDVQILQRIEKR